MLAVRVIPCLDVHEGRVVKGINFVDLVDAGDPVEQAKIYNDACAFWISQPVLRAERRWQMSLARQQIIVLCR